MDERGIVLDASAPAVIENGRWLRQTAEAQPGRIIGQAKFSVLFFPLQFTLLPRIEPSAPGR